MNNLSELVQQLKESKQLLQEQAEHILKQEKESKQLLQEQAEHILKQEKELEKYKTITYEEVERTGHVYIFSTDKFGIFKSGRTKHIKNRIKGLQTSCVDKIEIFCIR
jgi:hypothetical protein